MIAVDPDKFLLVGRIWRAHGVRGEIKVIPETDDPERFEALHTLYVGRTPGSASEHGIESVRYQHSKRGPTVLLKLVGIDTREAAESLRKKLVYAQEGDLPPLSEDELFLHDLMGVQVETETGEIIGTVEGVLQTSAHDVYVVERADGSEVMIPAVPEFITEFDLEVQRLVVRPIEGLLD